MPGFSEMLQALMGRVPQNAAGGGIPPDGGQFRNMNAPLGPLSSSAVPGRSYASGSPRGESAGFTTSSPGWRQDQVPTMPPPPATTGAIGSGPPSPMPTPRPDPMATSGIPIPTPRPPGEGMAVGGAGAFIPPAIPPSMLSPLDGLAGVPPALVNPSEGTLGTAMPPPLPGVPPDLAAQAPTVSHPPNPKTGAMTAADERFGPRATASRGDKTASTNRSTKKGNRPKSQYALMKERRANR